MVRANSKRAPLVVNQLGIAAAYSAACLLSVLGGLITRGPTGAVSVVWLPPGVALAIALSKGRRYLPGIWLGALAADFMLGFYEAPQLALGPRCSLALMLSIASVLQVESNRWLVRRFAGVPLRLDTSKSFFAYLLCGAVASLWTTSVGSALLVLLHVRNSASLLHDWASWWVSDAVSVVLVTPVALSWLGRPRHLWRPRRVRLGVPLMLALVVISGAFYQANALEQARTRDEFRLRADDIEGSFQRAVGAATDATLSVADFAQSSRPLDGVELADFARRVRRRVPSLLAITWVPRVPARERSSYERSSFSGGAPHAISELGSDGKLVTAGERDLYFPVEVLDIGVDLPFFSHFDLRSVESRRLLLESAERERGVVMSAPVELVGLQRRPGLLLVAAVPGERGETRGYVVCVLPISQLLHTAVPSALARDLDFSLVDLDAPLAQRALHLGLPGGTARRPPYYTERRLHNAGRRWVLTVWPSATYQAAHPFWIASALSVGGLVVAISLCGLLLVTTGQTAIIARQVKRRTRELSDANQLLREEIATHHRTERALQESERRWQFALEEAGEGLWDWDFANDVLFWSPRLLQVLGYEVNELAPSIELWRTLVHPDDLPSAQQQLAQYLSGERPDFRCELRLRHKVGGYIWFETHGKVVSRDADGKPLRMIGTQQNIGERKRAEHELHNHREQLEGLVRERTLELSAAKAAAESANLAKSVFLANMSHELRTPLHAVLGYARLGIEKSPVGKLRDYFGRIVDGAERLLAVLNDLLDLSKLEAGKMQLVLASADVEMIVLQVVCSLEPLISAKRLEVSVARDRECSRVTAQVDHIRIAQVLENVLANAIRFSGEGGRIEIRLADATLPSATGTLIPALAISVTDQGIGIPEAELELIFNSFTQSTKTDNKAGGTGLGLAICRELMALHHGNVAARNNSGAGATFIITLPIDGSAWSNAA